MLASSAELSQDVITPDQMLSMMNRVNTEYTECSRSMAAVMLNDANNACHANNSNEAAGGGLAKTCQDTGTAVHSISHAPWTTTSVIELAPGRLINSH